MSDARRVDYLTPANLRQDENWSRPSERGNARHYDAALGRFVSPDSLIPDPYDPRSYNRYSYVLNNPLRYTDPTGHWECGGSAATNFQSQCDSYQYDVGQEPWKSVSGLIDPGPYNWTAEDTTSAATYLAILAGSTASRAAVGALCGPWCIAAAMATVAGALVVADQLDDGAINGSNLGIGQSTPASPPPGLQPSPTPRSESDSATAFRSLMDQSQSQSDGQLWRTGTFDTALKEANSLSAQPLEWRTAANGTVYARTSNGGYINVHQSSSSYDAPTLELRDATGSLIGKIRYGVFR